MEIVKKNLISIICGVVALAAVVAVFVWPLDGFFETLKGKATARAQIVSKVTSLRNKPRVLPTIDPNPNTQKVQRLTNYPSSKIIAMGIEAQKAMHAESVAMYDYAWKLNQKGHGLVVPGTLPEPTSTSAAFNFRKNLKDALDNLRNNELAAGIPPTAEQLKIRQEAVAEEITKRDLVIVDGMPTNQDLVDGRIKEAQDKLPDLMKKEMAEKNKMYIDPATVLTVPSTLPENTSPTAAAIWSAQVTYWIDSDVASAIAELNANSTSVLNSPIKNLVMLSVPDGAIGGSIGPGSAGRGAVADPDAPTLATGGRPDATIALPDPGNASPTKRASNNLYDVVEFKLQLDMQSDKIPLFLKTLATNRFITVTRLEMEPVDSQVKQLEGYVYGEQPVVTLKLDCEALFMREWTIPLMPSAVRKALGIPDANAKL
jgi:hypothetical protein